MRVQPIVFLCLLYCIPFLGAEPVAAETLSPVFNSRSAKAASEALKKPVFGKAVPKALTENANRGLIETLRDWDAIQSNKIDTVDIAALVKRAADLQDFPRWSTTRRRVEAAMSFTDPANTVLAWFAVSKPVTGKGHMLLSDALIRSGMDAPEYTEQLQAGWHRAWLDFEDEDIIMARYGARFTRADHIKRGRFLIAYEGYSAARRMLPRLHADDRALLNARLKLRGFLAGVDGAIQAVPASLQSDESLILDRAYWRRNKGKDDGAMDLLTPGLDAMALVRPERLWRERHFWARRLLKLNQPQRAYDLTANHGLSKGDPGSKVRVAYADAEWTAGWIALRFLERPEQALLHFQRMFDAVSTPVSRSRGAYWLGRASQALGDTDAMTQWYKRAAFYPHRYYGRLAAETLDVPPLAVTLDINAVAPEDSDAAYKAFLKRPMVHAIRVLKEAKRDDLVGTFIGHIAWGETTPEDVYLMSRFGAAIGRPDLPLRIAKKLEADGIVYRDAGYPTIQLDKKLRSKAALMHAIARQESVFNPTVVSRAGARGLMQLMPATAKRTAKNNNMAYRFQALTEDPAYNMALSSHYLDFLKDKFSGTTPLMVASYNAGENAVSRWLDTYGDPRDENVDAIDWMELIPYSETRNYVQRVLEALILYDAAFTPDTPRRLHTLLEGKAGTDG